MAKVAINGMGRIGRATFKIIMDTPGLELAAVNDLVPAENLAYLLKYDTVYGRYDRVVESGKDTLVVDGMSVKALSEKDPEKLPWRELGVELVFECTGAFTKKPDLQKHITAGAKYAILSAPSKDDEVITIVPGVNNPQKTPEVISCASCTTNCIAPVVEIIGRRIGFKKAVMTTVHAYTASQMLVDTASRKMRRGRAGAANLVPTSTGAAKAATKALPEYAGRFDGIAVRAPVPVGSIADLVFVLERRTTKEEVNGIFREESMGSRYEGILGVSEDPIVSADIIRDTRASVVDLDMTQVVDGDLLKVMSWYDNEWGYSCQMVREATRIFGISVSAGRKAA
ncbi:MAG: type I glyceraldehyde-3-phosphate dehydrogenase [Nitrospirota bacterium]